VLKGGKKQTISTNERKEKKGGRREGTHTQAGERRSETTKKGEIGPASEHAPEGKRKTPKFFSGGGGDSK